jgi:hypothetical protein
MTDPSIFKRLKEMESQTAGGAYDVLNHLNSMGESPVPQQGNQVYEYALTGS